jgi:hypothetical protein
LFSSTPAAVGLGEEEEDFPAAGRIIPRGIQREKDNQPVEGRQKCFFRSQQQFSVFSPDWHWQPTPNGIWVEGKEEKVLFR